MAADERLNDVSARRAGSRTEWRCLHSSVIVSARSTCFRSSSRRELARRPQASDEALSWLRANAPPYDLENADTLFGAPGGVDGLEFGVAAVAANLTLDARAEHAWAAAVPQDVFNDYVLPYACANERGGGVEASSRGRVAASRRRGRKLDIPWGRIAATPRPRRG